MTYSKFRSKNSKLQALLAPQPVVLGLSTELLGCDSQLGELGFSQQMSTEVYIHPTFPIPNIAPSQGKIPIILTSCVYGPLGFCFQILLLLFLRHFLEFLPLLSFLPPLIQFPSSFGINCVTKTGDGIANAAKTMFPFCFRLS